VAETTAIIAGKLTNLVPYHACALFILDSGTDVLRCHFATGVDADLFQQLAIKNGEGVTGWVARNRRPLVNARPSADFETAGLIFRPTALQSALVCPLAQDDKLIGALAVYHQEPSFYRDDHRRLLDQVSEQASAVIANSLVYEQTKEDALTDPLTGLPNTRFLFMHLSREISRAQRLKTDVTLMVMDLDNFKDINDSHGHHVGDRALCEVARILRLAIRPYDICVRYAGDEFIIVLSDCSAEEAGRKKIELQETIDATHLESRPGKTIALGISVGAAVFPHDGESYETLLATADSRMYQDKASRRRTAASATEPIEEFYASLADLSEAELQRAAAGVI
jgi:diguanylate cyclase (GGDEF)-like protein